MKSPALILLATVIHQTWNCQPILPDAISVQAHFRGVDPDRLYAGLQNIPRNKGALESSKEHESKVSSALSRPILGTITGYSTIAVQVPSSVWYDVNSRVVIGKVDVYNLEFLPAGAKSDCMGSYLYLDTISTASKSTKSITLFLSNPKEWKLDPDSYHNSEAGQTGAAMCILLHSKAFKADPKSLKSRLRTAAIFTLEQPWTARDSRSGRRADAPYELKSTNRMIVAKLKRIVMYDLQSGQIIASVTHPAR